MGLKLNGATSGSIEIDVPAVAGTDTAITIPATTGGEFIVSDSAGNVGIGVTDPGDKLEIAHADNEGLTFKATGTDGTTATQITYEDTNGGVGGVLEFDHANNSFSFETAGSPRARIDSSGRVGINTTIPGNYYANHFVVDIGSSAQSGITIVSDTANDGMLAFADGQGGKDRYRGFVNYRHSNNQMQIGTDGNTQVAINSDGGFAFNSGYGSVGVAYGVRAWVYFNGGGGTNTNQTINGSANISSVFKTNTGRYTVNFANAMPDGNYCISTGIGIQATNEWVGSSPSANNTGFIRLETRVASNGAMLDGTHTYIAIIR
jgi:hypothetical protein